jgi:hypothetical protein
MSSNSAMALDTAGWVIARASAARTKLRWAATSRKQARWRNLIRVSFSTETSPIGY